MKSGSNYVTHILGVGTVASNEGEWVLTLASSFGLANNSDIIVSPYRNSSSGGGVDTFYGFWTSSTVYRVRHDFASTAQNRTFTFHIIGYD
jgi:hypothetical protein